MRSRKILLHIFAAFLAVSAQDINELESLTEKVLSLEAEIDSYKSELDKIKQKFSPEGNLFEKFL